MDARSIEVAANQIKGCKLLLLASGDERPNNGSEHRMYKAMCDALEVLCLQHCELRHVS